MATKTSRATTSDRSTKLKTLQKDIRASKANQEEFLTNPAAFAKKRGVTLTPEEIVAVRFAGGLISGRFLEVIDAGFFDHNCGCGGGGTASW